MQNQWCWHIRTCLVFNNDRPCGGRWSASSNFVESLDTELIFSTLNKIFNLECKVLNVTSVDLSPGFFLVSTCVPPEPFNTVVSNRCSPIVPGWLPRQCDSALMHFYNFDSCWRIRRIWEKEGIQHHIFQDMSFCERNGTMEQSVSRVFYLRIGSLALIPSSVTKCGPKPRLFSARILNR